MIAVDTNILVYAHRDDSPFYRAASQRLTELSKQPAWGVPWPCVHEFFSIVTHPAIFKTPTPMPLAIEQIEAMRRNPTLHLLSETDLHWSHLREIIQTSRIRGGAIHDAKIAAICLQHGVRELWSADRDFSRFPKLKTVNPLI
jgi:toxin-antitoxin system PIN domain toxin